MTLPVDLIRPVTQVMGDGDWVMPGIPDRLPTVKGAYLLALRLDRAVTVNRPRLRRSQTRPGWYLYAGSAKGGGGIRARVARHFRQEKKRHWHIDQLTTQAAALAARPVENGDECALISDLLATGSLASALPGFGASDCRRCDSHLLTVAPPDSR